MGSDELARALVDTIETLTDGETRQAVIADEAEQREELLRQLEAEESR